MKMAETKFPRRASLESETLRRRNAAVSEASQASMSMRRTVTMQRGVTQSFQAGPSSSTLILYMHII